MPHDGSVLTTLIVAGFCGGKAVPDACGVCAGDGSSCALPIIPVAAVVGVVVLVGLTVKVLKSKLREKQRCAQQLGHVVLLLRETI
eukprot:SAG11_NODE_835_length_6927_cov_2.877142_1_plen_86_part_00